MTCKRTEGNPDPECPACQANMISVDRKFLDTPTIDKMLADVRLLEGDFGDLTDLLRPDLCCHIKALAAERDNLSAYISELQGKLAVAQAREESRLHQVQSVADVCAENEGELKRRMSSQIAQLASDREILITKIREAVRTNERQAKVIEGLHDATIILRNAIGRSRCREELRSSVDEANKIIESFVP